MDTTPDWIAAIASVLAALSIIFVAWQTFIIRRQIADDHERSRREKAVDLLYRWSNSLQRESSSARRFVEALDEIQTRQLYNQKSMSVHKDLAPYVAACLRNTGFIPKPHENGTLRLDEGAVSIIRWYAIGYLNALESVMIAWYHNVADRDIISEQFNYLVDPKAGHHALDKLRKVAGGASAYPALEAFVRAYQESQNPKPPKPPLGSN